MGQGLTIMGVPCHTSIIFPLINNASALFLSQSLASLLFCYSSLFLPCCTNAIFRLRVFQLVTLDLLLRKSLTCLDGMAVRSVMYEQMESLSVCRSPLLVWKNISQSVCSKLTQSLFQSWLGFEPILWISNFWLYRKSKVRTGKKIFPKDEAGVDKPT